MAPDKTPEERIGILETGFKDYKEAQQDRQDENVKRDGEAMKRIERIENKMVGALGIGILLVLGLVANIIIVLLK